MCAKKHNKLLISSLGCCLRIWCCNCTLTGGLIKKWHRPWSSISLLALQMYHFKDNNCCLLFQFMILKMSGIPRLVTCLFQIWSLHYKTNRFCKYNNDTEQHCIQHWLKKKSVLQSKSVNSRFQCIWMLLKVWWYTIISSYMAIKIISIYNTFVIQLHVIFMSYRTCQSHILYLYMCMTHCISYLAYKPFHI